jgi:transcriptional regulator with XRE-family HTH domain
MDPENRRLKEARIARGYTLDKLAAITGYSIGAISGVENAHDLPSKRLRAKLIEALQVNAEWLRTGKGEMFSPESEANAKHAQSFDEVARKFAISISPEDRMRGFKDVRLVYRGGATPKGFPRKIRLTRPSPSEVMKLFRLAQQEHSYLSALLSALPEELRSEQFLDRLNPFCLDALQSAAGWLVFENWGELQRQALMEDIEKEKTEK